MARPSRRSEEFPPGLSVNGGRPASAGRVPCILQLARTNLPIEIPAEVLEKHRLLACDEIVLRIAGEEALPVEIAPLLTEAQQRLAEGWMIEMEDFDRF